MPVDSLVRSICVATVCLASTSPLVRAQSIEWVRTIPVIYGDGTSDSWAGELTLDDSGNIYATGSTTGNMFSEHLPNPFCNCTEIDAFLAKFNATGHLDWGVQIGTAFDDRGNDIALDGRGNLYVVGQTKSGNLFGEAAGHWDGYVAKFDVGGNEQWGLQFGDEHRNTASHVAVDSSDNLYVSGDYSDLDSDDHGAHLTKYDDSGTEIWHQEYSTDSHREALAINIQNEIAFITSEPDVDGHRSQTLRRLDAEGSELWTVELWSHEIDWAREITMDETGNTYITGGPNAARFLSKFDDDGQLLWTYRGPEAGGWNVSTHVGGGLLVSGSDPREGTNQIFSSFDENGNLLWTRSIDGLWGSEGMTADGLGNFYYFGEDRRQDTDTPILIKFTSQQLGDLQQDEILDVADIDALSTLIRAETYSTIADLNFDDAIDAKDLAVWVSELRETYFGDANLDGIVNFADFLTLSSNFGTGGSWSEGDFDASGQVNFADFLQLSANFGRSGAAAASVPEPSSALMIVSSVLGLIWYSRRNA